MLKSLSGLFGAITILLLLVSLGSLVSPRNLPHFLLTLCIAVIFGLVSVVTHNLSSRDE